MRKHGSTIFLFFIFLLGLAVLLYPPVSDYWNKLHQSRAIASYVEQVEQMDTSAYEKVWNDAVAYNQTLPGKAGRYTMSEEELAEYESLLNISGTGIMGYIEIPSIDCSLPIYHTTKESVLQIAVGHIEGTSLPTGGIGTHCVLSGHRGLPSAHLFTDLDRMVEGDLFILQILNETLTYEVDQVRIVEPYEMDALEIDPNMDYCTLTTCTPYGINSHRLLVRGHRVENLKEAKSVRITFDAIQVAPELVSILIAMPILIILLGILLVKTRKRK